MYPEGYYGLYRGQVTNNKPDDIGRIEVSVPAVLGDQRVPAFPCSPYAGPQVGFWMIPPEHANVWVAFVNGKPSEPVIVGCYWGALEKPAQATSADVKLIETASTRVLIDDQAKSITITPKDSGHQIVITGSNIEITTGSAKIAMSGSTVTVNEGALEVT